MDVEVTTKVEAAVAPSHPGGDDDASAPVLPFASDFRPGHRIPEHRHLRAQLLYAVRGVMTVTTRRGRWVVPPQQAVWVPAGTAHEVHGPGPLSMRSLYIHPSRVGALPRECCVVPVPDLLRELIVALSTRSDLAAPPAARLVAVVLDELARLEPSPLNLPLPADPRLARVTDRLRADPADGRSLEDWGREAGASGRTLARLFERETGLGFTQWRRRLRLVEAVARLASGRAVTTVALELGYRSPSAFVAMFRRALGEPPGRYLKR